MKIRQQIRLREGFTLGGRLDRTLHEKVKPSFSRSEPPQEVVDDLYWMEQALLTAMEGVGWSAPNPSVGAVIVDTHRQEIGRGFTQSFRKEHAEKMAIDAVIQAGKSLAGATLYVTLEPCSHLGAQPPCADLVVKSGIKKVVIGTRDPDPRVFGQGIEKLRTSGLEVSEGVLESECQAWHFPFIRSREPHQKIVWIAKWAQSPEGNLADENGDSKWISGPKSRAYTHWLRQKYDAILVSAQTYLQDRPELTVRDCALPHRRQPHRFVLDRSGRLKDQDLRPGFTRVRSVQEIQDLQSDLRLQSVLVEGGPKLLNSLFEANLFDAVHQFTGTRSLKGTAYRIRWNPGKEWYCAAHQKIDTDDLHEWVKSF